MYLGLDLGTTNVKAVVVNEGGQIVASGAAPAERFCTSDNGVEQDIEQIWNAVQTAMRTAVAGLDSTGIKAIGVSSQGASLQLLDPRDKPLGRVISWLDARGQPYDTHLTDECGSEFFSHHVGHGASGAAIGQMFRLRRESPELFQSETHFAFVGDMIVGRLCGHRAHDASSLSIALLYNPWLGRPDPDVMILIGAHADQLPHLLPATQAAGVLQESAANALGLRRGIPVSPAIHDQYASSLGAASVGQGDVSVGTGTAWVLLANTSKLAPPVTPDAFVCPHPVSGIIGQMLSMRNGGSAINWAARLLADKPVTVEQIDNSLDAILPGSDGLRFWPFLTGDPNANSHSRIGGRLSGIRLVHSPNHLMRAVVEGLVCELLRHIRLLTAAGFPVTHLTMCGNAAASRHTPQLLADIANLPVTCVEMPDVSAFGAAVIACKLVEKSATLAEISRRWALSRRIVHPGRNSREYCDLLQDYFAPFDTAFLHAADQ